MLQEQLSSPATAEATEQAHSALEAFNRALDAMPDDAPELQPYNTWEKQAETMLHMILQVAPTANYDDHSEAAIRRRMSYNFMIDALEALNGTLPLEKMRAVNEAVKAVHASS